MSCVSDGTASVTPHDAGAIVAWCKEYIANALNISGSELDENTELDRIGLDSAITTSMLLDLEAWVGVEIPPSVLFENDNLAGIACDVVRRLNGVHSA